MNNSMFYGYGNLLQVYLMLIILLKAFASSATNGGGGCVVVFSLLRFIWGYCRIRVFSFQQ